LEVPIQFWRRLQAGEHVSWRGRSAAPGDVLGPPRSGLAVAYVTDTRPVPSFVNFLRGVDLLVCEGTYGSDDDLAKAERNRHMTFQEAATLARQAAARRLWITHFSPALAEPYLFTMNATSIFPATKVGYDGLTIDVPFRDEP
ncbi:MAG: ribonuclease Z, partial [Chloroflexi bacterium]|nr:ribonuclease Z [Chloroflexota bacterium]